MVCLTATGFDCKQFIIRIEVIRRENSNAGCRRFADPGILRRR
jgi:hypothetical protein